MKRLGELKDVLERTIQPGLYQLHPGPCDVIVRERQKEGRAELRCAVPESTQCIVWEIEKGLFPFLRSNECADGALLIERSDGAFEAHVIECKRTIQQDSRSKAKKQMAWTLVRLHALAGALGRRLERAMLYTAYYADQLSKDPGLLKVPVGTPGSLTEEDAAAVDALTGQFDWPEKEIELRGFDGRFPHRAIRLTGGATEDDPPQGICALDSPQA
jgi:hypothetical protein